ncbi:MAG: ATP-binding protein, partial [Bacteroidales bacterium]|nr:ATP-binding protein [Bacteroidales bacterium]
MRFYDREQEIELLKNSELQANDNAMFTVVSGRRRIGKTSLILKSLEGKTFVYLFVARMSEAM